MKNEIDEEIDEEINEELEQEIEEMRAWFFENFQDPAYCCPYDGREGGYQFIYGGPYDAQDELCRKFGDTHSEQAIEQLAEDLEHECSDWSGIDDGEDDWYYNEVVQSVIMPSDQHFDLIFSINSCRDSIKSVPKQSEEFFLRLLFSHCITILETFLSEYAACKILNHEDTMKSFVSKYKDFKAQQFPLSDIFQKHEQIFEIVRKTLADIIWHNLPKVKNIYEFTFGIKIEKNIEALQKAILLRHDIIHRNGKDKNGQKVTIEKGDVENLLNEIEEIAGEINKKIEKA